MPSIPMSKDAHATGESKWPIKTKEGTPINSHLGMDNTGKVQSAIMGLRYNAQSSFKGNPIALSKKPSK